MIIPLISRYFLDLHKNSYLLNVRQLAQTHILVRTLEHRRSFDYYNRSRCLAIAFSFRKWFPPDGSRQSERISTWFPRTVRARTFAFRATAVHSAFAVARSLERNAKRKFCKKNEYVDKGKFTDSGKPSALFLSSLFGENRAARWETAHDFARVWKLHRYPASEAKPLISETKRSTLD